MTLWSRRWSIALALALLDTALPALAAPPVKPPVVAPKTKSLGETLTGQAKQDYEAAKLLFGDGDFAGSLIKFQASFDASKDPRLLWNVAACEKSMRHYARAIDLLKRYSTDTSGLVTEKDKADATELVKTLEPFTVALTIEVNEPDADIEVDDRSVGKSPLAAPVVVDLGQRKIVVRKSGFRDGLRTEVLGGSPKQTVAFKLEREVHEGRLVIQAPRGATITIDGQPLGQGKGRDATDVSLTAGGHTLRVTAPGMRLYEREVVVKENETRAVEVLLEPASETSSPQLRVAVTCGDDFPLNASDLSVYTEGSPTPLVASGGKQTFDPKRGRQVIDYVTYPIASGDHRITIKTFSCASAVANVYVDPIAGGDLHGALRPDLVFSTGPAGTPDFWRIALTFWQPRSTTAAARQASFGGLVVGDAVGFGGMIRPGLALRWIVAGPEVAVAGGRATFSGPQTLAETGSAIPPKSRFTWVRVGGFLGGRIPLNIVALSVGVNAGYDAFTLLTPVPELSAWTERPRTEVAYFGGWAGLDIYLLCDFALTFGGDASAAISGPSAGDVRGLSFNAGFALQPNRACRRERDNAPGLQTGGR